MLQTVYFFVYGTLKRGQCREKCWPISPVNVQPAWTFGRLFDLGPYPALVVKPVPEAHRVAGEVWGFHAQDFGAIATALDRIEGTDQPNQPNEYDRVVLPVTILPSNHQVLAQAYVYSRADLLDAIARPVPAELKLEEWAYSLWPVRSSWP
jgi:gamma-glutamylcyclotransferase (GGCT)/AIG2-like uncharacterized protein YtfP